MWNGRAEYSFKVMPSGGNLRRLRFRTKTVPIDALSSQVYPEIKPVGSDGATFKDQISVIDATRGKVERSIHMRFECHAIAWKP